MINKLHTPSQLNIRNSYTPLTNLLFINKLHSSLGLNIKNSYTSLRRYLNKRSYSIESYIRNNCIFLRINIFINTLDLIDIAVIFLKLFFFIFLGRSTCDTCPGGYVCLAGTNSTAFPCNPGYYCPPGTEHATQYPCPAGSYNPLPTQDSILDCLMCPPGQYCEGQGLSEPTGNCSTGWFCTGGAEHSKPIVIGTCSGITGLFL